MSEPDMQTLIVGLAKVEAAQGHGAVAMEKMSVSIDRLIEKLERSDDTAREALQSIKSMHHRMDEIRENAVKMNLHFDGEIRLLNKRIEDEIEKVNKRITDENKERVLAQRWIIGVAVSVCAVCTTIIFNLI